MSEVAAPLRRTPLHAAHRQAGARLVEFAGWELPVQYTGVMEEHRAVRSAAGLFDVSHMGEVRIGGGDAERFLQRLTPNDVTRLEPGRAHYSGLLDERGTYVDDLVVYRLAADEFLLVVNAANLERDLDWIRAHAPADAAVEDRSESWALLALQGPRAPTILARLTAVDLAAIKYYRFASAEVAGRPAIVSRTGYTGEDGFEIFLEPAAAPAVWGALLEAGTGEGLVPAGLGARDTLRLEAGMALYGHEIDATTTPWEAGLDWVVKLEKGDFVGRAALVRQREAGLARKLVGFEVTGRGIARQGHKVFSGAAEVGAVTSGTFSPTLERALGMAYVPLDLAPPGTELAIEVRGKPVAARTRALPFYKRAR